MKSSYISTFLFILFFSTFSYGQCPDPTSIGVPTVVNASCPGTGSITVLNVLPAVSGVEYYQYSLYNSTTNTDVYSWQDQNVFPNMNSGTYEIRVRKRCGVSPFISTGYITRTVVVNNTEVSPSISQIKLLRKSKCNNGAFEVSATSVGVLGYALVNSISESEPVSSYVRPRQASNRFENLAPGTYYVRVYNSCNNAVSASIVVPEETSVSSVNYANFSFLPLGCDSLGFGFNMLNYTKSITTFSTDSKIKGWVQWPDGSVDSLSAPNQNVSSILTPTTRTIYFKTNLNKIDPSYNPTLPWPTNLTIPSFTIIYGFVDACGVNYSNTYTYTKTNTVEINPTVETTDPSTDCDNVAYSFTIKYTGSGVSGLHGFTNYNGVEYSLDGGGSWLNAFNQTALPGLANSSCSSVIFTLTRGTTVNLLVRYCGSHVLSKTFVAAPLDELTTTFLGTSNDACFGKGNIRVRKLNANGTRVGLEMISAPAGQALVPYFEPVLNTGIAWSDPTEFINLLPGEYSIKVWDTIGVDCPRSILVIFNVTPFTFDFSYTVDCNKNLNISINKALGPNPGNTRVKIFDHLGNLVLGGSTGIGASVHGAITIPSTSTNTLVDGTYTIRIFRNLNNVLLDDCSYLDKTWIKNSTNNLNLGSSVFLSGCQDGFGALIAVANGGLAPYNFSLFDVSDNPISPTVIGANTFNGLITTNVYRLNVIDGCGQIVNRLMSSNSILGISVPGFSSMPCLGNTINISMPVYTGISYAWYKDDVLIPSANSASIQLTNLQSSDAGVYKSVITIGSCSITKSLSIDPDICGSPLPVELNYFGLNCDSENNIEINWETLSENGAMDFVVHRSRDASSWDLVGVVSAIGNSSVLNSYTLIDFDPINGGSYYRLTQRDFNGQENEYQPSYFICNSTEKNSANIYPNPTSGNFNLDYTVDKNSLLEVSIMDMKGKKIVRQNHKLTSGFNSIIFHENLSKGIYLVYLNIDNKEIRPIKLIVN